MDQTIDCKRALMLATYSTLCIKKDGFDLTGNSLLAVTAAGTIQGTYVSDEVEKTLGDDLNYVTFKNIGQYAEETSGDALGAILLKDATLFTSHGTERTFNYLYIFTDDLIALSFGNFSDN